MRKANLLKAGSKWRARCPFWTRADRNISSAAAMIADRHW